MGDEQRQAGEAPLISVVTVCFNSERYLAEAMESVRAQGYSDIEYIVVDGGSTDGTLDVIRSFEPRFAERLRWVSEPDEGIYDAMNKGIAMCTGALIGLLNSDDRYAPGALERVAEEYLAHPEAGGIYGDAEVIDLDGSVVGLEESTELLWGGRRPDRMPMCHQALFVTRATYAALGGYDTRYRVLADYDFVLRCLGAGVRFVRTRSVLAQFRLGGVCNTDLARLAAEQEAIRVAYGANPVIERLRRMRHAVNRTAYALLRGKGR